MDATSTAAPNPGRRGFLGLNRPPADAPRRPPWAVEEPEFSARCDRCSACMAACPAHLLLRDPGGYPAISFRSGACTFCGRCAEACATGALARSTPEQRPWRLTARIAPGCLALKRIECRVCGESCEAAAIRFVLAPGRVAQPVVIAERCTGCGACANLCPAAAIRIEQHLTEAATA